jgi:hypothetical protein
MLIEEKIKLNKIIRKYEGVNPFVLSLKKQLQSSKYLKKEDNGNRTNRVLSEKQYEVVIKILDNEEKLRNFDEI